MSEIIPNRQIVALLKAQKSFDKNARLGFGVSPQAKLFGSGFEILFEGEHGAVILTRGIETLEKIQTGVASAPFSNIVEFLNEGEKDSVLRIRFYCEDSGFSAVVFAPFTSDRDYAFRAEQNLMYVVNDGLYNLLRDFEDDASPFKDLLAEMIHADQAFMRSLLDGYTNHDSWTIAHFLIEHAFVEAELMPSSIFSDRGVLDLIIDNLYIPAVHPYLKLANPDLMTADDLIKIQNDSNFEGDWGKVVPLGCMDERMAPFWDKVKIGEVDLGFYEGSTERALQDCREQLRFYERRMLEATSPSAQAKADAVPG